MARILIRPEDLARLARRFDAAADDLARAGRRLARTRAEVRLNRADEAFSFVPVAERAALVEADLRRLAAEFRVDAGLMARTVDDAELDGEGSWTPGLSSSVGVGTGAVAPIVGTLESVVAGLMSLSGATSSADDVDSLGVGSLGAGGLFVTSSTGADRHEVLARLTERLGASTVPVDPAAGPSRKGKPGIVWSRIVGELFGTDDGPQIPPAV